MAKDPQVDHLANGLRGGLTCWGALRGAWHRRLSLPMVETRDQSRALGVARLRDKS
jgi:hypothetical protein